MNNDDPVLMSHSRGDQRVIHIELARPWNRARLEMLRSMADLALDVVECEVSRQEQRDAGYDPIELGA